MNSCGWKSCRVKTLQWVQQENQRTVARFGQGEDFQRIEREVLDILNKDTQIPWVSKRGEYYYNFWQDQANPRGLLRRTTLDEYRKAKPAWETVLDIDALGKAEGRIGSIRAHNRWRRNTAIA